DNPWNQNISTAPVASNSAAIISHIGTGIHLHANWYTDSPANGAVPLYGIPFNVVHGNSTPKVHVTIDVYPGQSDIVDAPIPANPVIEGDFQNGPNLSGPVYTAGGRNDSHMLVWDEDNNVAYEFYQAARPTDAVGPTGQPTGGVWHAAQETVWDMKTNTLRPLGWASAHAAGGSAPARPPRPPAGRPGAAGGPGGGNAPHPLAPSHQGDQ